MRVYKKTLVVRSVGVGRLGLFRCTFLYSSQLLLLYSIWLARLDHLLFLFHFGRTEVGTVEVVSVLLTFGTRPFFFFYFQLVYLVFPRIDPSSLTFTVELLLLPIYSGIPLFTYPSIPLCWVLPPPFLFDLVVPSTPLGNFSVSRVVCRGHRE